jgi:hypothetical protein
MLARQRAKRKARKAKEKARKLAVRAAKLAAARVPLTMSKIKARRAQEKNTTQKMKAKGCVKKYGKPPYYSKTGPRRYWKRGWVCPGVGSWSSRRAAKKAAKDAALLERIRIKRLKRGRRRHCFSPETPIKLQNGETRAMKNLELGDILINGSTVTATMQIKNESDPYYKIHSEDLNTDILVTGSHYIQSSGRFIRVSKFDGSVVTQNIDPIVICIITSDHKVPIGEYTFWDWEDQLVN